jgi:hypothetical protein
MEDVTLRRSQSHNVDRLSREVASWSEEQEPVQRSEGGEEVIEDRTTLWFRLSPEERRARQDEEFRTGVTEAFRPENFFK